MKKFLQGLAIVASLFVGIELSIAFGGTNATISGGGGGGGNPQIGAWSFNSANNAYNTLLGNQLVGIGTSTPFVTLEIASSSGTKTFAQLGLTDNSAGLNLKHWLFSSYGGNLYIATSSDQYATSSVNALTINSNGSLVNPILAASSGNNCLQVDSTGKITNTGSVCAPGGSSAYPFTPGTFGTLNTSATSTAIFDNAGIIAATSTFASLTATSTENFTNLAQGVVANGITGNLYGVATSSAICNGGISCSGFSVVGSVSPTISISAPVSIANGGTATTTFYNGGLLFYNSTLGTISQSSTQSGLFWNNGSGLLGIGTSSPQSTLAVSGNATIGADYNTQASTNGLSVEGNFRVGTTTTSGNTAIVDGVMQANKFVLQGTGSTNNYTWSNGNPADATGMHTDSIGTMYLGGVGSIYFRPNGFSSGTGQSNFDSSGNLFVAGTGQFSGAGSSWFTGKLGIGTTSPFALLSVHGTPSNINTMLFAVASSTATATSTLFGIDNTGHWIGNIPNAGDSSIRPSLGSCGTSPSITATSTDVRGTILTGSGSPILCQIIFARPYTDTPTCMVSDGSTSVTIDVGAASTTGVNFKMSAGLSTTNVYYLCIQ